MIALECTEVARSETLEPKREERQDSLRYCSKLYTNTPITFTGWPESFSGGNVDCQAASSQAARRSGCPLIARAQMTLPASSNTILTSTVPEAPPLYASAG